MNDLFSVLSHNHFSPKTFPKTSLNMKVHVTKNSVCLFEDNDRLLFCFWPFRAPEAAMDLETASFSPKIILEHENIILS